MKVLRMRDIPDEKYTNAFLGYGPEETNFVLELTYSKCSCLSASYYSIALMGWKAMLATGKLQGKL